MMTLENALADTSYNLELEKLKKKIQQLYTDLVTKQFKQSHPGATQEQLEAFLEENELEFKETESFDEEADGIDKLLELMVQDEDLDKVSDKTYAKADVESGKELKAKSKEKTTAPLTKALKDHIGGLFTPSDKRIKTNTKALKTPKGTIKQSALDPVKVDTKSIQDVWDAEREKLLVLVRKRNKEHGVKFW